MSHDTNESVPPTGPDSHVIARPRERPRWLVWAALAAGLVVLGVIALVFTPGSRSPASAPGATPTPPQSVAQASVPSAPAQPATTTTPAHTMPAMGTKQSWILLPPLPATATQADKGAEIYRLVCGTCHGFAGEGLSYGPWVKTSAENCWQAKCHGGGHPEDGFELPRYIPPVIGPGTLTHFQNALALYAYMRATMPAYAPGTMLDEEYWEVTAFLVRENGFDPILKPLDPQRAAEVTLR